MKVCKQCNVEKEYSEYYSHYQKGKNGQKWQYYDPYCKVCRLKYSSKRIFDIKLKAIEYLGGKCKDCGLIDIPCVYDFHHLDPSKKEFTFAKKKGFAFETIKSELDKCILLCSNCHRKRHSK